MDCGFKQCACDPLVDGFQIDDTHTSRRRNAIRASPEHQEAVQRGIGRIQESVLTKRIPIPPFEIRLIANVAQSPSESGAPDHLDHGENPWTTVDFHVQTTLGAVRGACAVKPRKWTRLV